MTDLSDRIEAAGPEQQRDLLEDLFETLHPPHRDLDEKRRRFRAMLDAEAYLDAALMLVPKGWHVIYSGPLEHGDPPGRAGVYQAGTLPILYHAQSVALALAAAIARSKGL